MHAIAIAGFKGGSGKSTFGIHLAAAARSVASLRVRRWKARKLIARHFVEFNGVRVLSVKTAFKRAVKLADLPGKVTPHTLRHTAATWLMQNGVDPWEAAGYLGMSVETLLRLYGHHHPDYMMGAVEGITRKPKREQNNIVTVGFSEGEKRKVEKPA